jgi:hypothetical protein
MSVKYKRMSEPVRVDWNRQLGLEEVNGGSPTRFGRKVSLCPLRMPRKNEWGTHAKYGRKLRLGRMEGDEGQFETKPVAWCCFSNG